MSQASEYSRPLRKMNSVMLDQLAQPDNVAKPSWLGDEKTTTGLYAEMNRNYKLFGDALANDEFDEAWKRAANVANYLWMILDREENRP